MFDSIFPYIITFLIAFTIGILGDLGLFKRIANQLAYFFKRIFLTNRADFPKDFRYKSIEIGARIFDEGFGWETIRKAKIISQKKNLQDIEVGVQLENIETGSIAKVEPDGEFDLIPPDPSIPTKLSSKATKFIIHSNTPIRKNQLKEFIFYYSFKKIQLKRTEQLFWAPSTRDVERLTLRLILTEPHNIKVYQEIYDASGTRNQSTTEIKPDRLNLEYNWTIDRPRKNLLYSLTWIRELNGN